MSVPTDRVYSSTHEWFLAEGNVVTMGISQYAADELTDITYVELPEVGTRVGPDSPCGGVESVKAYSEVYCAVAGKVIEVNAALADEPGLVNEDAYDGGWMVRVQGEDLDALGGLMDAKAYRKHIRSGG
ncbi:MAG: glycine cleavage system protein GcvH [Planctomycetota bacterium]|jgi:glycine cleavage system H protein